MADTLAQNVRSIVMERKGANYLTYATQPFTGRVFPQQTYFDPTTSKLVRFATRAGSPAIAKKGNRVWHNLQQMYAMMFIKKASEALPKERARLITVQGPKFAEWGRTIKQALADQINDADIEALAQAIENNIPPSDPRFPQVKELKLPEEITSYIDNKGEDGLSVLEGLIDYAEFTDAMAAGKPHHSFFNAYMDGKTNGIANNGIQLGNERIAKFTGVFRDSDKRLLDGDKDIRDVLGDIIHSKVKEDGIEGMDKFDNPAAVQNIVSTIGRIRDLQKNVSMTYSYGMELGSFIPVIEEAIEEYIAKNPDISTINEALPGGIQFADVYNKALEQFKGDKDKLLKTIHKEYMTGLETAMSPEAAEARTIMRANATMYSLMDKIFSIVGPAGFNLNMAGTQILEASEEHSQQYSISKAKEGDPTKATAYFYQKKDTSAAEKKGVPGLHAYGRSLTTPVQALDASTVAQTVTGKSWEKLKAVSPGGKPYIHTIYDAFKVDANGYDTVLEEVNKNWLDTSFDWSYLEQTRDAYKRDFAEFKKELDQLPDDQILTKKDNHGINVMDWMFSESPFGGLNLTNRIKKTTYNPKMTDKEAGQVADKITQKAVAVLVKMGYKPGSGQATVAQYKWFIDFMHHRVYDLNDRNTRFTMRINNAKKELRSKINPKTVYQYYSH